MQTVNDNETITGTLTVGGLSTLNGGMAVSGAPSTLTGGLTVNSLKVTTGGLSVGTNQTHTLPATSLGLFATNNYSNFQQEIDFFNTQTTAQSSFSFYQMTSSTTATQLLVMLPNGNVGIGVPAPTSKLHVVGGAHIDLLTASTTATGSTAIRLLSDRAAERLNLLDYAAAGTTVDRTGATDASAALATVIGEANTLMAAGQQIMIYVPAGKYLIKGPSAGGATIPPFALGYNGSIMGDGPGNSVFLLDTSFSGDLFSWCESWSPTRWGIYVGNLMVMGNRNATNQQNAFMFYGRIDFLHMENVSVWNLPGRAFCAGLTSVEQDQEPAPQQAYMRESHINNLRFWYCGAAGVPVMEFTSTGKALDPCGNSLVDGTNEVSIAFVDIFAAYGPSLVIRNNSSGVVRDMRFTKLRIEPLNPNGTTTADLLTVGDPTYTGKVVNISFTDIELVDQYPGYAAMRLTAPAGLDSCYNISVHGTFNGGAAMGDGLVIDSGRNNRFNLMSIVCGTGYHHVVLGPNANGQNLLDLNGLENTYSYSITNPPQANFLQSPSWRVGIPSSTGPSGGTTTIAGTISADAITATTSLAIPTTAPISSTSAGVKGQIAMDASYFYTCVASNSWRRIPLSTF